MPQTPQEIRRTAKRLFRWCLINGQLDQGRARAVAQHILGKRRRGYISLAHQFERLLRADLASQVAKVESAFVLPLNFQARVRTGLNASYGRDLNTLFLPNRSLIGGMRVQVGSDVYDGSVRAKLEGMAHRCGINAPQTNSGSTETQD